MIFDYENEFAKEQAETTVGAHDSQNVLDLGVGGDDADELFLHIRIDEDFASAGAATAQFKLLTSDSSDFSSADVMYDSGAIGKATLIEGHEVAKVRIPRGIKRYMKVTETIGTAALTAGKFSAGVCTEVHTNNF